MKKKVLNCLLFIFVAFSLTGCVKYNASMDISKDKSMDFSIIYAVDTSIFGDVSILDDEDKSRLNQNGFNIVDYADGNMKGFTISKSINNIDSFSVDSDVNYSLSDIIDNSSNNIFYVKKGFLKNVYTAKFSFDADDSDLNNDDDLSSEENIFDETTTDETIIDETTTGETTIDETTTEDLFDDVDMPDLSNSFSSGMDLSFNVKLPYPAISSNATVNNDSRNLSWTLVSDSVNTIEFQFYLYNLNNILIVAGSCLLLVILIIIFIIFRKRNKKKVINSDVNTFSEIPELDSVNPEFRPFSEQDFNQQLMSQSMDNDDFIDNDVSSNNNVVMNDSKDMISNNENVDNISKPDLVPEVQFPVSDISFNVDSLNQSNINPTFNSMNQQVPFNESSNFEIVEDVMESDNIVNNDEVEDLFSDNNM